MIELHTSTLWVCKHFEIVVMQPDQVPGKALTKGPRAGNEASEVHEQKSSVQALEL